MDRWQYLSDLNQERMKQGLPPVEPTLPPAGCVYTVLGIVGFSGGAFLVHELLKAAPTLWMEFPNNFSTTGAQLTTSVLVLLIGALFFWLRENIGVLYATIELGAASAVAFDAARGMHNTHEIGHGVLGILGAVYVSVRGYDNLTKWLKKTFPPKPSPSTLSTPVQH